MTYDPETLNKSGIYAITNKETGRRYIGRGCFRQRWARHRQLLRRGIHYNKALQADWNNLGESAFDFDVLEIVAWTPRNTLEHDQEKVHIAKTLSVYNADSWTRLLHPQHQHQSAGPAATPTGER